MRYLIAVFFSAMMLSLPAVYRDCTKGFRADKFWIPEAKKQQTPIDPDLAEVLKQDFYYLKQGTQSYVFESADGKYVLKLFRYEQCHNFIYKFIRTKIRHRPLRLPYEAQKNRLFSACRIATELAQEETALVAIHLEETENLWPTVQFHIPLGRIRMISLDKACFAIQKKGDLIYKSLIATVNAKDVDQMKRKLDSLYGMLKSRTDKGIVNLDWNLHRNFGFIGDKAIEIDFGAYDLASEADAKTDFSRFYSAVRKWLSKRSPEWVSYWDSLNDEK